MCIYVGVSLNVRLEDGTMIEAYISTQNCKRKVSWYFWGWQPYKMGRVGVRSI
jgi:hypothetical protein